MSTNQNTNKNNSNEPSFDEFLAYEELRMIFVIAIETQNFENIETRIAAWEKKYPLAEFQNPEIIRKIKTILNKDFLSRLLGDYLAAKLLHEQEKQKESYESLKKIISDAKKSKNYKSAQKEIRKWKDNLHANGFNLYSFNRLYRAKVCTLLLIPDKALKNQEQALYELKKLKENSNSMDSKAYFEAVSNWQNTYSIADFPDKLKKEINQITTIVFDSISQKRASENAISEIKDILASEDISQPANAIASVLSKYDYSHFDNDTTACIKALSLEALSIQEHILNNGFTNIDLSVLENYTPAEVAALTSLKDILNSTPNDTDRILNWIYVNRKISYSDFAKNKILEQFLSAGYKIPEQSSYAIPETNPSFNYNDCTKIDELRKKVILNYLGIISQGNKLSIESKDNLINAHTISTEEVSSKKNDTPIMFLEAFDTVVEEQQIEKETLYDEEGNLDIDNDQEDFIYNIFIEDIIDNPLATYSIQTIPNDNENEAPSEEVVSIEPKDFDSHESSLQTQNAENHEDNYSLKTVSKDQIEENNNEEVFEKQELPSQEANSQPQIPEENENTNLSIDDNENLEQAYELSTYFVVAVPILEQVLTQKKERSTKKIKTIDRTKDL